ncbi:MAG: metal ABC transporter permease [bacterium]
MDAIYDFIEVLLPFAFLQDDFMKRALITVVLIAPLCAAMGVMVVNFRMAFFSDAISHSAFTGVALGMLMGLSPDLTLIVFGVLVGVGIISVRQKSSLSVDTVIGVFFSFTVALGIVIISVKRNLTTGLHAYLFGDVLTVSMTEIGGILVLFLVCLAFFFFYFNDLFLLGINERLAKSQGVRVRLLEYAYALLLALVVTVSIRVVGLLLVTAMLVVPAAAGRNMAHSVKGMFWWSVIISLVAGVAGIITSYHYNPPAGATIILIACGVFLISQVYSIARK